MPTIKISDLKPSGSELFIDSESYLDAMSDEEINTTNGGSSVVCYYAAVGSLYAMRSSYGCAQAAVAITRAGVWGYNQGRERKWW